MSLSPKTSSRVTRLGIIGAGRIARAVMDSIRSGEAGDYEVCSVLARRTTDRAGIDAPLTTSGAEFLSSAPDLIIEAAGPPALAEHGVDAIAVANIWLFFYTPQYGLLAQILGIFGINGPNWLGSNETALFAVTVVAVWKEAGFFMIFYLAALQTISPSLAEAAALEGASRWTYFRRIQFPLLMPTTLFVLVNAVIGAFRTIDHIFVMTRGGPDNATALLLFYIYQVGFSFWDTTYAAALTVVLLVILGLLALIQYGVLERRVHYR